MDRSWFTAGMALEPGIILPIATLIFWAGWFVVFSALVGLAGMKWIAQLKRARKAEQERERVLEKLKQSERRLKEAQQVARIGSWERDLRTNQVTWSDELYRIFGLKTNENDLSYQKFLDRVVPQDVDRIRALVDEAVREGRPFNCDYRITLANGSIRLMNDRGGVILNEEGAPIRLVGTAQDVTELRMAELAMQEYAARLKTLSRRVVEVQEEERRHLARELHDEIGQVLSAIGINLQAVVGVCDDSARSRLEESIRIVDDAIQTVRNLSLDLRPSMLDDLGLISTLRWYADRQAQRSGFILHFNAQSSFARLPAEVETACYRVVQEALTNVIRHARARQAWLDYSEDESEVRLLIRDDGVGFDTAAVRQRILEGASFGVLGMQERVTLLGGRFEIDSIPAQGTTILVRIPVELQLPQSRSDRESSE
jgi:two-component system sensor histidine kinase UhpB